MDRVERRADFSYIRYANCWEDGEILCEALEPLQGKRILSIASAGDNSLALIAGGAEVLAVDLNPAQLACVELRKEAILRLDREACLAFMGIIEDKGRVNTFHSLSGNLSDQARQFWEQNIESIDNGFIHSGKFEKYFQCFRKYVLTMIHPGRNIQRLLQKKQKQDRFDYYDRTWANFRWHMLFKIFFSRTIMGRMGRDPEFFRYVDVPVSENILKRAKYALTELSTHDNPYLDYILTGNFKNSLPYYLWPDNYERIKRNTKHLTLFQGSIQDAINLHEGRKFDGFNLSDIFEYLDFDTCKSLYSSFINIANPGARLVYWNMLVPRKCPEEFRERIINKDSLAKKLFEKDKAFFYSDFIVEEVR